MKIGELAKQSGIAASTIRFYEKKGLLPEARRLASGYRVYDDNNLKQLQLIRFAQSLGFSLEEMTAIFDNNRVDHDQALQHLQQKRQELETLVVHLQEKQRNLGTLIEHLQHSWENDHCMSPESLNALMRQSGKDIKQ
ncbi:MerR family transcriptional regulator [Candidatus Pelagadaptatus aseana]|uniref:MerR family transcriptional regulator n=1 Tax=Candidatus Pelagadaptatus aseana TaxID=3120508 RepID=UPI003C6F67AC